MLEKDVSIKDMEINLLSEQFDSYEASTAPNATNACRANETDGEEILNRVMQGKTGHILCFLIIFPRNVYKFFFKHIYQNIEYIRYHLPYKIKIRAIYC